MMRTPTAAALAALVLAPALTGCLGTAANVVASAPKKGNGLTITVSAEGGPIGGAPEEVEYAVTYQGEKVYPPPGLESIELGDNGLGSKFVEYRKFVVGNGDYRVDVDVGDQASTIVYVEKYVRYVFLNPYLRQVDGEDILTIDMTLQSSAGGDPNDRVIAKGEATLEIRYRGENGGKNQTAHSLTTITNPHQTFTRVSFPVKEMDHYKGEGWYSVGVSFDNLQAEGNFDVGLDPTFGTRDPPRNWVHVEGEEEDDGPLPPPR